MLEKYLHTHDQQLGFKSHHATDMCIFTVKSVIKYYTKQNSTAFTRFLDAAKAFDRVSHWTLFSKMIKRYVPLPIVIFKKKSFLFDMHHHKTYMYINFQQNRVNRSVITVRTNVFTKKSQVA